MKCWVIDVKFLSLTGISLIAPIVLSRTFIIWIMHQESNAVSQEHCHLRLGQFDIVLKLKMKLTFSFLSVLHMEKLKWSSGRETFFFFGIRKSFKSLGGNGEDTVEGRGARCSLTTTAAPSINCEGCALCVCLCVRMTKISQLVNLHESRLHESWLQRLQRSVWVLRFPPTAQWHACWVNCWV